MNKQDIIRKVKASPFGKDIILMHGASMIMHGSRKTTDVIIAQVNLEEYPSLMLTGKVDEDGVTRYRWEEFDFGDGQVRDIPYDIIHGIKCQTISSDIKDRIQLVRGKGLDVADQLIEVSKWDNPD